MDLWAEAAPCLKDVLFLPGCTSMFLVVDDTYRPVRRRLHYAQPAKGGVRALYSRGTVFGIRKGMLVGISNGNMGCLCDAYQGTYRYYDIHGKRQSTKRLRCVSNHFMTRRGTIVGSTRTCRLVLYQDRFCQLVYRL